MKRWLLVGTLLSPPAFGQVCTPPGPADAVGYDQMTYGGGLKLGQNIFNTCDGAASQNADGSISISGGTCNHFNNQINTGTTTFGGGAYIQGKLAFKNAPAGWYAGSPGWPAFWASTLRGDVDHVETDFLEYMTAGKSNQFDFGLHDWHADGSVTWAGDGGYHHPTSVDLPANFDPAQPHTYGFLWVPSKGNSQGTAQMFVDDKPVGPTYNWSPGGPFSSIDKNQLQIMFGSGPDNPMTVYDLQVWQGPSANNSGVPAASGGSGGSCAAPIFRATTKSNYTPPPITPTTARSSPVTAPDTGSLPGNSVDLGSSWTPQSRPITLGPPISLPNTPPPSIQPDGSDNLAPFADPTNCPGMTYYQDFTKGQQPVGWNYGGTGDLAGGNAPTGPSSLVSPGNNGLTLTMSGDGNTAMINTHGKFYQQYGYYEMTANLDAGLLQGNMNSAFWLMAENGGWPPEVDVEETIGNTGDTAVHSAIGQTSAATHQYNMQPGRHVWAVDWNAQTITFYIDGKIPTQDDGKPAIVPTPANFHQPMYMILSGIGRGGGTGHMTVDNVRAFKDMKSAQACVPQVDATQIKAPSAKTPMQPSPITSLDVIQSSDFRANSPLTAGATP